MKIRVVFASFALLFFANAAFSAAGDSLWLYPNEGFQAIQMQDTLYDAVNSYYPGHAKADTGDVIDGEYMNFDYQFTDGWAACKIIWDYGDPVKDALSNILGITATFNGKILEFDYKGALATHNISVYLGASAGCGDDPSIYYVGTIPSSTMWTKATLFLPDSVDTIQGLRELRFVIHNTDTISGSLTSDPANLKIDNILVRLPVANDGVVNQHKKQISLNNHGYFMPTANGSADLSFYNAKGALLFSNRINVSAGQRYSIHDFALKNSSLLRSQIYLMKIQGPGINMTGKIR